MPQPATNDWAAGSLLLPFIEQQAMYDTLQVGLGNVPAPPFTVPATELDRVRLIRTSPPAYLCPSDTTPKVNNRWDNRVYGACSYPVSKSVFAQGRFDGFSFRDITDGLSNTIMVGERCNPGGGTPLHLGAIWITQRQSNASWGCEAGWLNVPFAGTLNAEGEYGTEPSVTDTPGAVAAACIRAAPSSPCATVRCDSFRRRSKTIPSI